MSKFSKSLFIFVLFVVCSIQSVNAQVDYRILQHSLDKIEQRRNEASEEYLNLSTYIGDLRQQLKTSYWAKLDSITKPYLDNVKSAMDVGDWDEAKNRAMMARGDLAMNSDILELKRKSKEDDSYNYTTPIKKLKTHVDNFFLGDTYNEVYSKIQYHGTILGNGDDWMNVELIPSNYSSEYFKFQFKDNNYILSSVCTSYLFNDAKKAKVQRDNIKNNLVKDGFRVFEAIASNGFKYYYLNDNTGTYWEFGVVKTNNGKYNTYVVCAYNY